MGDLNFDVNVDKIPVGYLNIIKTKTPSIQKQEGFRTIRDFIDLFETAKAVYENIMDGRFYRNPGTHCGWCDYAPGSAGKGRTELAPVFERSVRPPVGGGFDLRLSVMKGGNHEHQ